MSGVGGTGAAGISAALSSTTKGKMAGPTLGQADFLRLMTAQMTMQDPFNPIDNRDMIAQMAQFSQVAGIAEINKNLATMAGAGGGRMIDSGWIGRSMLVESDAAAPLPDGSYAGEITLPADAAEVSVSFLNEAGEVVHRQDLGAAKAGPLPFAWDGRTEAGAAANGPLRVVVAAGGAEGTVASQLATWTNIRGIQSPAGGAATRLVTPLGLLTPEQAQRLA